MEAILHAQRKGEVIGLKGVNDQPVARLDIDDLLYHKPDAFNLFLLAFSELQESKNASDKMSYQQIAGIHGLPTTPWDKVEGPDRSSGWGYCAHGRPTFPTWHRPYLAMMEQTIYVKMAEIVKRYPAQFQSKYQAALKEFRLPYWDYFRPRNDTTVKMPGIIEPGGQTRFNYDFSLPRIFVDEEVLVRHYENNDELRPFPNPFAKYSFPKVGGLSQNDWILAKQLTQQTRGGSMQDFSHERTVRYPESETGTVGNVKKQSAMLNRERESNLTKIILMIQNYDSYGTFASSSVTPGASGNLESIHGAYHMLIGGGSGSPPGDPNNLQGHMSHVPIAAFDPVFWMHHCLIDRWFAIWQAAHPKKWYDGKFKEMRNGPELPIAPLAMEDALPFRFPQKEGKFWNGDLSRSTTTFGYIYNDAVKGSPQEVINNFVDLYAWGRRTDPRQSPPKVLEPLPISNAQVFKKPVIQAATQFAAKVVDEAPQVALSAVQTTAAAVGSTATFAAPLEEGAAPTVATAPVAPGENTSSIAFTNLSSDDAQVAPTAVDESKYNREWYVDHIVKRLALNGSFAIYFFVGRFDDDDINNYGLQPTMAGLSYIFTSSREICDNCGMQDDANVEAIGTKVITPMLRDYVKIGVIPDLTPATVVPFLTKNLKWRVVDSVGNRRDPRQVDGFRLGISSSLEPISGEGQPLYEEYPQVIEQIIANSS